MVSGDAITALSDLRAGDNVYFSVKQDYDGFTLEELAEVYDAEATYVGRLERQPDTQVGGEPAIDLIGRPAPTAPPRSTSCCATAWSWRSTSRRSPTSLSAAG